MPTTQGFYKLESGTKMAVVLVYGISPFLSCIFLYGDDIAEESFATSTWTLIDISIDGQNYTDWLATMGTTATYLVKVIPDSFAILSIMSNFFTANIIIQTPSNLSSYTWSQIPLTIDMLPQCEFYLI